MKTAVNSSLADSNLSMSKIFESGARKRKRLEVNAVKS